MLAHEESVEALDIWDETWGSCHFCKSITVLGGGYCVRCWDFQVNGNGVAHAVIAITTERRRGAKRKGTWQQCRGCTHWFYSRPSFVRLYCSRDCWERDGGAIRAGKRRHAASGKPGSGGV